MQPYPTVQNYSYNPYMMSSPMTSNLYNQPQTPQIQMNTNNVSGRVVNDFSEITASDIPMDGRSAVFVKNDKSEIQVREWSPNGQIVLTSYLPNKEKETSTVESNQSLKFDPKTDVLEPLMERIEELENKIDRLSKTTTSRVKKEGGQE